MVVVSELTTGTGKTESTGHIACLLSVPFRKLLGTLKPLALLTSLVTGILPQMVLANPALPSGGQVTAGSGIISINGDQMTIQQNSRNMVASWNTFDIGKNNMVRFVQPDSSSVALNRVTGGRESQLLGTLTANGQVMLINPAGVMFGQGSQVNTAGLVASTKNISNADFMKGNYMLSGGGNLGAQIVNQGSLTTAPGGYIVLAADRVRNSGSISTPEGKIVLAAGDTVKLQMDNGGLTSVSVNGSVVSALAENRGLLSATDGQVYLTARGRDMLLNTVVNNTGTAEARGLRGKGGDIVLDGGDSGVVRQAGQILADSSIGTGGSITLEGRNIHLAADSLTSATGKTGGGNVNAGGGWQGKDSRIKNAAKVVMDKTAVIDVSAGESGNGGQAVLWSDEYTDFRGTILAKGGSLSGDGGRVETSSFRNLQAFGDVIASAVAGRGGEWLLDPLDVTIVSGTSNTNINETGRGTGGATLDSDTDRIFSPSATGAQVSATKIQEQLNTGTSVTVDTHGGDGSSGNITFNGDAKISKTSGGDATLTLRADNNIQFSKRYNWSALTDKGNGTISSTMGKLNLNLLAADHSENGTGTITVGKWVHMWLNGGDFTAGSNNASNRVSVNFDEAGRIEAGNITLNAIGGTRFIGSQLDATSNLTVNGSLRMEAKYNVETRLTAGNILTVNASSGDIAVMSKDSSNGKILLSGVNNVRLTAENGTLWTDAWKDSNHGVDINSSAGAVVLTGFVQNGTTGFALKNTNITSVGDTTLNGLSYWGEATKLDGVNINSTGNVIIRGLAKNVTTNDIGAASAKGIIIRSSNITSQNGNVSLSGLSGANKGSGDALSVSSSNISANTTTGKILLNGTTTNNRGVNVTDSNFSANALDVKGVATTEGNGFVFSNTSLNGTLSNLTNVTLSSANSANSVVNILDTVFVNMTNNTVLDTLLNKGIENMTQLDASGMTFGVSNADWVANYSSSKDGIWIFDRATVNKTGNISLQGVGFSNSTVNAGKKLTIDNGSQMLILNDTNVSADADITLTSNSTIKVQRGNIISNRGNVTLLGTNPKTGRATGVDLVSLNIAAENGNITINGTTPGTYSGVRLTDVVLSANSTVGNINIYGQSTGGVDVYDEIGSVSIQGDTSFTASQINITGNNTSTNAGDTPGAGVGLGTIVPWFKRINVSFTGNVNIVGSSAHGTGVFFAANKDTFRFNNGTVNLTGTTNGKSRNAEVAGIGFNENSINYVPQTSEKTIILNNATVNINGNSTTDAPGIALAGAGNKSEIWIPSYFNGFIFEGDGNVNFNGTSEGGNGVILSLLNNTQLRGKTTIRGESQADGRGVVIAGNMSANLTNTSITGQSQTGSGIFIDASSETYTPKVDLTSNTLTGNTGSGEAGIEISGNNVAISGGTLTGTSKGSGVGVKLTGGQNYILCGTVVNGSSVNGIGVSAEGNLKMTAGTSILGTATDNGDGVTINGTLSNTSEPATEGTDTPMVVVTGKTKGGVGINFTGDSNLTNITLNGSATSGSGIKVSSSVILDERTATTLKANSESGIGLSLDSATLKVVDKTNNVVTAGVQLNGASVNGSGVSTSGNVAINGVILDGRTESGTGVTLGGNLTLGDTVSGVNAAAANGTSINLNNVTFNATNHGSDPLWLEPSVTGDNGTAIKVSGDTELINVALNGDAVNGRGVVIDGNLTTNRSVSGTTENGTALTISGRLVNSAGLPLKGTATGGGIGVSIIGDIGGNSVIGISSSGVGASLGDGAATGAGSTVTGTSETGSGAVINGRVNNQGTVSGTSQKGSGTELLAAGILRGAGSVSGGSTAGIGVSVTGNTGDNRVSGTSSSGVGVSLGDGAATGIASTVSGSSVTGSGVVINGGVNNQGAIRGTSQSGIGTDLLASGILHGAGSVSGGSTAGIGVSITGNTGDNRVSGTSSSGVGVSLGDGAATGIASTVSGSSVTGSGVVINGGVNNQGAIRGTSQSGIGTDLTAAGILTGIGSVSGTTQEGGIGTDINGTVRGNTVNGESAAGIGVMVNNGATVSGTAVNGHTQSGIGVFWRNRVKNNHAIISGDAQSGRGVYLESDTTLNDTTVVGGRTQSGTGVFIANNLSGGTVVGKAGSGDAVNLKGGAVIGTDIIGDSRDGSGVMISGPVILSGGSLTGRTVNGTGLNITSGALTQKVEADARGEVVNGGNGRPYNGAVLNILLAAQIAQEQSVQNLLQNHSRQVNTDTSFGDVDINICTDTEGSSVACQVISAGTPGIKGVQRR
ncbi:filamentous hemagglutinin N-terminal domain-containing protein [Morganella morganii]|uniref:two-partner secretion domain-containing protein n=1 Tax=Morganella morganii TaxID=582 RepID=UPI001D14A280